LALVALLVWHALLATLAVRVVALLPVRLTLLALPTLLLLLLLLAFALLVAALLLAGGLLLVGSFLSHRVFLSCKSVAETGLVCHGTSRSGDVSLKRPSARVSGMQQH
jgi:hypothetical protein